MRYIVTIESNFSTKEFESNSRNSIEHLRNYDGNKCIVTTKSGKTVSAAMYSPEFGYYHVNY